MRMNMIPANLSLLDLTPNRLALMVPVTSLDFTEGSTDNFHEEGLFSTKIFGRVESDLRDTRFSYIDIKVPVLHPLIYRNLIKLKGIYSGIISGRIYATWDENEKDFVQSNEIVGDTGYYFFYKHWKDIVFKQTGSDIRDLKIRFIEKWKSKAETRYVVVIPAGLRDLHKDNSGRMKQDEINDIYRSILSVANTIGRDADIESSILDVSRYTLQNNFNKLFDHIQNLLDGKGGFLQKKWASRRIYNGTRNVVTAMNTSVPVLGIENSPKQNNTVVGVYQMAKAALPFTKRGLATGWLSQIFGGKDAQVKLTDPQTLKAVEVFLDPETTDRWTKSDGLEKVIATLSDQELRGRPVYIGDYYAGLVYVGTDATYKVFSDIDEVPEGFDRSLVHPMTLIELVYLSCFEQWQETVAFVTRYPITGEGSTYPTYPYVKTTVTGEMRFPLNEHWVKDETANPVLEFPIYGLTSYQESMSAHPSRVAGLGLD